MRFFTALLCVLILCGVVVAQKKYLVTPNQEIVPLLPGQSPEKLRMQFMEEKAARAASGCSGEATFGYDPLHNPPQTGFGFTHKTTMGEWFVAPANGTIDTFYFTDGQVAPTWAIIDSTVYVRIFESNITPTHGPGVFPGLYPSPCRSWGYWLNSNDIDQGVAAFREDATDTTWHSTIETNGGTTPSFPPFGNSIWGFSGFPVKLQRPGNGQNNKVAMADLTPGGLHITKDQVFFFSLRMASPDGHIDDGYQQGASSQYWTVFNVTSLNATKPARDWKFYEHDSGPSNCAGTLAVDIKRGWVARGPLSSDTNAGAVYNVWYVMTPTSNIPPSINSVEVIHNTTSTASQSTTCEITDCDAEDSLRAGVKTALLRYTFRNALGVIQSQATIPLSGLGFDLFLANIPGAPKGTYVSYKVVAFDSTGAGDSTADYSYRVLDLNSSYYRMDTTLGCFSANISGSGTAIDTAAYFEVPGKTTAKGDDGTAGPFSLGGPFVYFGDTLNYAWVGVNGAIALTKTATETLDVNANGFATQGFDFPQRQFHGRGDTSNRTTGFMPRNFIAPYWADWIVYQDSPRTAYGVVRHSNTGGKFITEWDGVGAFFTVGPQSDIDTFRVILDRATGTIQFQYANIGTNGLDAANLTGIASDSLTHPGPITPFNYFNKNGYPTQTHLHNGLCVSYYPDAYTQSSLDGWNMVSVGETPPSYARSFLFPTSVSNAFRYSGSYVPTNPLSNGPGYWIKFAGAQALDAPGSAILSQDVALAINWNMIGSVSKPVAVGSLTTTPTGITASPYFGFNGSYFVAPTIVPGKAYWVKCSSAGTLHIVAPAMEPKQTPADQELAGLNRITVQDKLGRAQTLYIGSESILSSQAASRYEMPPPGPEGSLDVRFISQRMVEVHPSQIEAGKDYAYPVSIQGAVYPLTVKWEAGRGSAEKLLLLASVGKDTKTLGILEGSGKVTISDAGITRLVLKLTEGVPIPKAFALSQNYPNPFNPVTHFSVDIPTSSAVEVTVYDVLGRRITTLMTGEQEPGYHLMEWDSKDSHGLNVPSGMYMVRMNAGDFNAVRKIMLMK